MLQTRLSMHTTRKYVLIKFNKVKYLTDCRDYSHHSKKNYIINKLLGVSVYLKLYSIGFSVNDIIFNLNDYFSR